MKHDHHYIHQKFRRMMWDPNWGDKDNFSDDGVVASGVINNQLQKIEEYRVKELKRRLHELKKPQLVEGACRSQRN